MTRMRWRSQKHFRSCRGKMTGVSSAQNIGAPVGSSVEDSTVIRIGQHHWFDDCGLHEVTRRG